MRKTFGKLEPGCTPLEGWTSDYVRMVKLEGFSARPCRYVFEKSMIYQETILACSIEPTLPLARQTGE